MKKIIFSAALLMAAATVSFAGSPKETKEAKAETKTETTTFTYYVTGEVTLGSQLYYTVGLSDPGCDDTGAKPCEVISSQQKDGNNRIPSTAVQSVESTRTNY